VICVLWARAVCVYHRQSMIDGVHGASPEDWESWGQRIREALCTVRTVLYLLEGRVHGSIQAKPELGPADLSHDPKRARCSTSPRFQPASGFPALNKKFTLRRALPPVVTAIYEQWPDLANREKKQWIPMCLIKTSCAVFFFPAQHLLILSQIEIVAELWPVSSAVLGDLGAAQLGCIFF
jgi:hypothetical protein